jgi:hypothetical protein
MLAPALLAGSAVPIVAIRAVFRRARRDGLFRIRAEELRGKVEKLRQSGARRNGGEMGNGHAYFVTMTRLAKARGLRMGDRPYTIAIVAINLS